MLNGNQKVNAIAWEANKQGVSYGIFSPRSQRIKSNYESYLEEKQKAEKIRLKKHNSKRAR